MPASRDGYVTPGADAVFPQHIRRKKSGKMSSLSLHAFYAITSSINGTVFGALLFGGFVDCRTLLQLVSDKEISAPLAKSLSVGFEWWWPNGAKLMIPLLVLGAGTNGYAYLISKKKGWLVSMAAHLSIAAFTSLVMGGVIKTLMSANKQNIDPLQLREAIQSFCTLHFIRIALAGAGVLAGNAALECSLQ
jgi:hypothetical protein